MPKHVKSLQVCGSHVVLNSKVLSPETYLQHSTLQQFSFQVLLVGIELGLY